MIESGRPLRSYANVISANAYLGVEAMLPALASDADVIITGRVADPKFVPRSRLCIISAGVG